MNANLGRFFKYLALIARGIGVVPLFIILSYLYSRHYVKDLLSIQCMGMLLVVIGGYLQVDFQSKVNDRLERKKWLVIIIVGMTYIAEVSLIIGASIYLLPADILMKFITCVMYIIMFGLSIAAYEEHYTRTLPLEWIVGISFIYIFAMALCHYSILGMMYILIIASYIFLNNQVKLEALLARTEENTPMFKKIRKDNMKWVCLLMSIFVIAYPLKGKIASLLEWIWDKILALFALILRIIIWILSFLSPEQGSIEPEAGESGFGGMPPTETNEFLDLLFWVMIISITIFVVIKKRKTIIRAFNNQIDRIQRFLDKAYKLLFGKREKVVAANGYYEDVIEELSDAVILSMEKTEQISKKSWQKQVKQYLKHVYSEEQYRYGYKLVLQGLRFKKVDIDESLTPREIMVMAQEKLKLDGIESQTMAYEYVRYREEEANEAQLNEIKSLLKELLELNKA